MEVNDVLKNAKLPAMEVQHQDLERFGESDFRSICPVCGNEGLFMRRSSNYPFNLLKEDNCMFCGRAFIYTDIKESVIIEYE